MPVSVCFVIALQKKSKNEVAQKIPKKYQNSYSSEGPSSWRMKSGGGPQAPGPPLARPGGTRAHRAPGSYVHRLRLPFGPIYTPQHKNPRYISPLSRSVPDLRRHRNLASGVTRILFWNPAGEGLGPGAHLHQLFFTS